MRTLDRHGIAEMARDAAATARGRTHQLWHVDHGDPVQRLAMVLQPGSYVRPHRHDVPPKWETLMLLSGHIALIVFDDDGCIVERITLSRRGVVVAELPPATWHSLVALEPGSALFEFKQGPFAPSTFAAWSPAEGDASAAVLESWLRLAGPGDRWGGVV